VPISPEVRAALDRALAERRVFRIVDVITGVYAPRVRISIQRFAPFLRPNLHTFLHTPRCGAAMWRSIPLIGSVPWPAAFRGCYTGSRTRGVFLEWRYYPFGLINS